MSELRGLHLHFDGSAGAAGDMALGAFFDLGVPESVVRDAIAAVGIEAKRLRASRAIRGGLAGIDVVVDVDAHDDHDHDHHHHHYADIRTAIADASLDAETQRLALAIFHKLAVAEAGIHGMEVDAVAFHEVGAIDSIVDIVGAAACVAYLDPVSVSCAPIATGSGRVKTAHGLLPVPAPATLALLTDARAPTVGGDIEFELCTPTAAAIFATIVTRWGEPPAMSPRGVGYGLGDRDLPDRPNALRLTAGEPVGSAGRVTLLETNIDDMTPELLAHAVDRLSSAGAIDVWWQPCVMKKGRPGVQLAVLADAGALDAVRDVLFAETSTLGVRETSVARSECDRQFTTVETAYGDVPIKVASWRGRVVNAAPEYEACRALAETRGVPAKQVYAAAVAAHHVRGMLRE